MILVRCPECQTTFRVTPEQLRARSGKVRCGQCQKVFNALEALVETPGASPASPDRPLAAGGQTAAARPEAESAPIAPTAAADEARSAPFERAEEPAPPEGAPEAAIADRVASGDANIADESPPEPSAAHEAPPVASEPVTDDALHAGQTAGLIAARDTRELPGYSKWAERPLAGLDSDFGHRSRRPRWPFVVVAILLALILLLQAIYFFRAQIAAHWPATRPALVAACAELGCTVPLPREAELISIEGSELQADPERGGLLILQATLKNRAEFDQAYPLLELTLTDVQDKTVVRRVLTPQEYLTARHSADAAFAAGAEVNVRLWIDAGDSGASGYRLYVFFP